MTDKATKNPKTLRLRKRAEFLAVRNGEKRRGKYFLMEVNQRDEQSSEKAKVGSNPRVGFTVTKKNGNAVIRNRIRRRLKAALSAAAAAQMAADTDYVIVARKEALNAPFTALIRELSQRVKARIKPNA